MNLKDKNKLILISLNELNFDYVVNYLPKKNFKAFEEIIKNLSTTKSERKQNNSK